MATRRNIKRVALSGYPIDDYIDNNVNEAIANCPEYAKALHDLTTGKITEIDGRNLADVSICDGTMYEAKPIPADKYKPPFIYSIDNSLGMPVVFDQSTGKYKFTQTGLNHMGTLNGEFDCIIRAHGGYKHAENVTGKYVHTHIYAWSPYNKSQETPDSTNITILSEVNSEDRAGSGVIGHGVNTIRGYELNGEVFEDNVGDPQELYYEDVVCCYLSSFDIAKTHEAQTIRAYVKSFGQQITDASNIAAWDGQDEVSVDIVIPAKDKYTVTYNGGGSDVANIPQAQTKWHNETLVLSDQIPTKKDATFLGWATSSGGNTVTYKAGASYTGNQNITLYPVWKMAPNTIRYDANGGTGAPEDQTKKYGVNINLSTVKPTRQGYTFQGWATSAASNVVEYQSGATYSKNEDVTLYAVWKIITYTITYNANGGVNAPTAQNKDYGATLTLSATEPTKEGHVFQGWATSVESLDVAYRPNDSYTDNADITLYAVWKIITYTISYNANGGTGAPVDQTKEWNSDIILSDIRPTREGYNFKGWATSAENIEVEYNPSDIYAANADRDIYAANADLALFAIWEIIVYTITYDANGGYDAPESHTKEWGTTATISDTKPKKINSEFLGWSTTSDGQVEYAGGSIYNSNANLSLFAVWRRIPIMKMLNGYKIYDEAVRELSLGVTTSGTGAAYKADVKAIDALTVGVNFTIIPHVANTTVSPTLDINNFGAKAIRQRLSNGTNDSVELANGLLAAGKPVHVVYDGVNWIVDMPKPVATQLEGVVPVSGGGTGATVASTALNNLGITWGTAEPPANGTPGSIYIQIN